MAKSIRSSFNRGLISRLALGRQDLDRTQLAASQQTNWVPRVLGPMSLRPGLKYIGAPKLSQQARFLPFVYSSDDTALIELTNLLMRVWVDDELITRSAVTAAVTNGTFDTDLTGWTDSDEAGASSTWLTGGYMKFVGTGFARAIRKQAVSIADISTEHALRIVVTRGPVTFRCGSTDGAEDYIAETVLKTGTHSLAFTPTGATANLHFSSAEKYSVLIDSVAIEAAGVMELPTPWTVSDLYHLTNETSLVRYAASGDVLYLACSGRQQRKIERRAATSWSVVLYEPVDGPFRVENILPISISASATDGDVTLTASAPIFKAAHVGALFRIDSIGQFVDITVSAENQFSSEIRVSGVGAGRNFALVTSGTYSATVTLQRSIGAPGNWTDVQSYTGANTVTFSDGLDNQIAYYRIGVKTGGYVSGSPFASLTFTGGSITGIVRIVSFSSATSVGAIVLQHLGGTAASDVWAEGAWSDHRGWPSGVALYDGRLNFGGKNKLQGSISDAYEAFDDTVEGDSGPLSRSIGEGPVDSIAWLAGSDRLLLGTYGAVHFARASALDEPLSPAEFGLKKFSPHGCASVAPVDVGDEILYVHRSTFKVYALALDGDKYKAVDLTALVPEIGSPGFTHMVLQTQPDMRVHCVRNGGAAAMLVYDPVENVRAWVNINVSNADIEDAVVLPGVEEDAVYYVVHRVIEGVDVRYLEKWALQSECVGGTVNKQADSFILYSGTPTTAITGLDHLEGLEVVVWADGDDHGTYTVESGRIDLSEAVSEAVVGLSYQADYTSTKIGTIDGVKRVNHLQLLLADTHAQGLQYGPSDALLDELPLIEDGVPVTQTVWTEYHNDAVEMNGSYDVNTRIHLRAVAPKPCTVLAVVMEHE